MNAYNWHPKPRDTFTDNAGVQWRVLDVRDDGHICQVIDKAAMYAVFDNKGVCTQIQHGQEIRDTVRFRVSDPALTAAAVTRRMQFNRAPVRPDLDALLDQARDYVMSEDELAEQRRSWVRGEIGTQYPHMGAEEIQNLVDGAEQYMLDLPEPERQAWLNGEWVEEHAMQTVHYWAIFTHAVVAAIGCFVAAFIWSFFTPMAWGVFIVNAMIWLHRELTHDWGASWFHLDFRSMTISKWLEAAGGVVGGLVAFLV